ncbi:MAG: hypothetical protein VXZ72_00130 [Chlamydiota bacterium]|nr:hypothetical protein [Chlamydiota bacterium]
MSKPVLSFVEVLEQITKPQTKPQTKPKPQTRPSVAALIAAGWSKQSAERFGK